MKNLILILAGLSFFLITGCTPPPTVIKTPSPEKSSYPVIMKKNDTLSYIAEFPDEKKRTEFIENFKRFMKDYPYADLFKDSGNIFIKITVTPTDSMKTMYPESLSIIEQPQFTESFIESHTDLITEDSITDSVTFLPEFGGSVRLYISRNNIDPPFSLLTSVYPFPLDDNTDSILQDSTLVDSKIIQTSVFEIINSSARRITLKLNPELKDAKGKSLSALDVINAWTEYIKAHPVEGLALFRHVEGIKEFIRGNEAIIRGFGATDQKTIVLKTSREDNNAITRLKSSRLLVESLKLGLYYIEKSKDNKHYLLNNPNSEDKKAFLEQLTLFTGGDDNPILSFSLNKYDAVTVSTLNDLSYAKTNLLENASLIELQADRYFISCPVPDIKLRKYISSIVDPSKILRSYVKEEGEVIGRICDTAYENQQNTFTGQQTAPHVSKPLRILYRKDDRTSRIIAEKLLADLSAAQIPSKLMGKNISGYEKTIASDNCEIIVGWILQCVINNKSEQLRLGAIWFDDETDEQTRIQQYKEIPLFKLNRYLLVRKNIDLYKNSIRGIYIHSEKTEPDENLKFLNEF